MVGICFEKKAREGLLKVKKVDMTFEDDGKARRCAKKFFFINFFLASQIAQDLTCIYRWNCQLRSPTFGSFVFVL